MEEEFYDTIEIEEDNFQYVQSPFLLQELIEEGVLRALDASVWNAMMILSTWKSRKLNKTREVIGKKAGVSEKTVSRSIKRLEDVGFVRVITNYSDGKRKANTYFLRPRNIPKGTRVQDNGAKRNESPLPKRNESPSNKLDVNYNNYKNDCEIEISRNKSPENEQEDLQEAADAPSFSSESFDESLPVYSGRNSVTVPKSEIEIVDDDPGYDGSDVNDILGMHLEKVGNKNAFKATKGGWIAMHQIAKDFLLAGFSPEEVLFGFAKTMAYTKDAIRLTIKKAQSAKPQTDLERSHVDTQRVKSYIQALKDEEDRKELGQ